jgi:hypothetical protein
VQLRKGERLTRNWSNKGLHVNALEGKKVGSLNMAVGKDDLRYSPKLGDLASGRIGNGLLEYEVPVASAELAGAALGYQNLKADAGGLVAADAASPGVLTLRMPSSYVYLSGRAEMKAAVGTGGSVRVEYSDNNGLDWREVARVDSSGAREIDLKPLVSRRYDYRLRLTLAGAGTKVEALKLTHDVQHSQRALPALGQGENHITFSAGPQEGTVTVQGNTDGTAKGKNLTLADFHPTIEGFKDHPLFLAGAKGSITIPVTTPGDLTRLRVGAHYRARGAKDAFDVEASFDEGKSWRPVGKLEGPTAGSSRYFVLADVPKGSRAARVRLAGRQSNTLGLFDLRVDGDYAQPHGGFAPVKVTYVWEEGGVEKRDEHVASKPEETYTISCAAKPVLKRFVVERAD